MVPWLPRPSSVLFPLLFRLEKTQMEVEMEVEAPDGTLAPEAIICIISFVVQVREDPDGSWDGGRGPRWYPGSRGHHLYYFLCYSDWRRPRWKLRWRKRPPMVPQLPRPSSVLFPLLFRLEKTQMEVEMEVEAPDGTPTPKAIICIISFVVQIGEDPDGSWDGGRGPRWYPYSQGHHLYYYTPRKRSLGGYIGITPSVCLSVCSSVRLSRVNLTLAITF